MQRTLALGLTRAIGVSNFDAGELAAVCAGADTPPAVNQIQLSPFEHRFALLRECERLDVAVEAWSPLTHGRDLGNPTVVDIAGRIGRTPAQVLLRWGVQRGATVLPKSTHRERIAENAQIFDFALGNEEMTALDALDRTGGTGRAVEDKWWTPAARARALVGRLAAKARRRAAAADATRARSNAVAPRRGWAPLLSHPATVVVPSIGAEPFDEHQVGRPAEQ